MFNSKFGISAKWILIIAFLFIVFVILNIFFYSFITISIYKFLCYDSNIIASLIDQEDSFKKDIFSYFSSEEIDVFITSSSNYYSVFTQKIEVYLMRNNYFFYVLKDTNIDLYLFNISNYNTKYVDSHLVFLNFYIRSSNFSWVNTISLQKTIIVNLNETSLFFFRMYNPSHVNLQLITLYMIYPSIITLYVNKVQCFCFNTIFLYSLELVDLPVLVYINPFISLDNLYLNNIIIYYIVFLNS